ncbi:MAG: hypothetical protein ACTTKL_10060 [Treponema sp.]
MEVHRITILNTKLKAHNLIKTILFFTILTGVLVSVSGCMHTKPIKIAEMNLQSDTSGHILNLHNYGDVNLELLNQAENLVAHSLINKSGDEFGYYAIDYGMSPHLYKGPSVLGHIYIPGALLGLPMTYIRYYLTANLYIFDSEGNLVTMYEEKQDFLHVGGLYYGYNATKKAAKHYSKMFSKMFEKANAESAAINGELKKKGIITETNKKVALPKIRAFFATHKKQNSKISNLPI